MNELNNTKSLPILAIVSPCYNEEEVLIDTVKELTGMINQLIEDQFINVKSYLLLVDDGSKDRTFEIMMQMKDQYSSLKLLKLSKNFGHQAALLAGLETAHTFADILVSIDADLQDDKLVIKEMVSFYSKGYEIVFGVRKKRDTDTLFKRITAEYFYSFMKLLGVDIIFNHADYRLASSRVLKELFKFQEVNLFLRGIFHLVGFKTTCVYYDRKERLAGESKYPLKKMLSFALDGITSFSVKPLRLVTLTGFLLSLSSLFAGAYAIFSYLFLDAVQGWTSIVLPMYFLGGIQLFCIGLLGEYIGKIYKEVKRRPRFIIEQFIS